MVLSLSGTGLPWVAQLGFNAGSALNSGTLATSAFAATPMGRHCRGAVAERSPRTPKAKAHTRDGNIFP